MKIAQKLSLAFVLGVLAVHTAFAVVRVEREREVFEADASRDARVLGRGLGHAVKRAWVTSGEAAALSIVEHATSQETDLDIRWVWPQVPGDARLPPSSLTGLESGSPLVLRGEDGALLTYVPVRLDDGRHGAIEIADPFADERAYIRQSIQNAALSALLSVALSASIAWIAGWWLLGRPVGRLVDQARAIGQGDLGARAEGFPHDELGLLAREMAQMSAALSRTRQKLEQETESRLKALDQLRHADRLTTVGTLASGIAHELGTPLNVIDGYAALIEEDAASPPEVRDNAGIIRRQGKRVAHIVRQLLDFARRGTLPGAVSDPLAAAREVLDMVTPLAKKQRVELQGPEGQAPPPVALDHHALQQALTNVIVNGIQAMPEGGVLTVRVQSTEPSPTSNDRRMVHIAVQDQGVGMPDHIAARMFEPFFTTKRVGEGTGLGLAVVHGIVEEAGGSITVDSRPGRGTTVTLTLPADEVAHAAR